MLGPLDALDVDAILEHFPKWRHLPQPFNFFDGSLNCIINFLFSCESANTKSKRAHKKSQSKGFNFFWLLLYLMEE